MSLAAGDCVFFNPAVFHAAGANRTPHIHRMANLLQVSSAMGRAMETVDRVRMSAAVYGAMQAGVAAGWPDDRIRNVATAVADGYAFPTNLDKDPPVGGLTPPSHLDVLLDALRDGASCDEFSARLDAYVERRRSV